MRKNTGSSDVGTVLGVLAMVAIILFSLARACSPQAVTRNWGGEMDMYLEPNLKLVEVTWKDDNLWYLTKPMTEEDIAETYTFQESDTLGMFEGTLTIIETKVDEDSTEYKEYIKWREHIPDLKYTDFVQYKKDDKTLEEVMNFYDPTTESYEEEE